MSPVQLAAIGLLTIAIVKLNRLTNLLSAPVLENLIIVLWFLSQRTNENSSKLNLSKGFAPCGLNPRLTSYGTALSVLTGMFSEISVIQMNTRTLTDFIVFCQDICLPTKTVTQYPNSKPWFNKFIRSKIVAKDAAYRCRDTDPESYRNARSALKKAIRREKRAFRDRVEKFESGDSKALWSNMNLITNYKGPSKSADPSCHSSGALQRILCTF